jgi:hypothetical protein
VLEPLAGLLSGGLARGQATVIESRGQASDYLTLALLAGALRARLWCAAVGVPELGGAALGELLGDALREGALERLLMVPEPGGAWAQVLAALADGVDLLLVRPPGEVSGQVGRRVDARLREGRSAGTRHAAALLVLGAWPTTRLVLRTERSVWTGLDGIGPSAGTGHLTGARATVLASGRATAGRPRTANLWLPGPAGAAEPLTDSTPGAPVRTRLTAAAS